MSFYFLASSLRAPGKLGLAAVTAAAGFCGDHALEMMNSKVMLLTGGKTGPRRSRL